MIKMALARDGVCLGGAAAGDCSQQFVYDWDEVGRLERARRWDNNLDSIDAFDASSAGTPAADLRHTYDASDQRVIKEAVDAQGNQSFTLYVFASLELRRAQYGSGFAESVDPSAQDYEISHYTVVPYLMAGDVRLARLVYHGSDEVPEEVKEFTGVIKGIHFDFAKATVRADSHALLDRAAQVLKDYPNLKLEISGHSDSVGARERNMELSQARAEAVKDYLVEKGIDAERLTTRGVGPDEPVADNATEWGRQQNRRVELTLVPLTLS